MGWKVVHSESLGAHVCLVCDRLRVMTTLGSKLLLAQGPRAKALRRRVVSRRRGRCALGLVSAMVSLLQRDKTLYNDLCPHVKLT
jgi:hypothetical protein